MRLLFVSGTSVGGAARSTYELADVMRSRGHVVSTLMTDDAATATIESHKRWLNAVVKLDRRPATKWVARIIDRLRRRIGSRTTAVAGHAFSAATCALPENAFAATVNAFRPDIVVVNSIERPAWRAMRDYCAKLNIPTVLYIREASGVRHLVDPPTPGDLTLANAEAHADEVRTLGLRCEVVPSVVETDRCQTSTDRSRVVMVNPVTIYGIDLALDIAARMPDVPFTYVESWPLTPAERERLQQRCDALGNAELLPYQRDPRAVYQHCRILLMLCTVPSRPRVVLEAQSNGIPVLAVDRPGHGEVVGHGGVLVSPDATLDEWVASLRNLWENSQYYDTLRVAALDHAQRHDATPEAVADRFETLIRPLLRAASS